MTDPLFDAVEREQLCALFNELGPDAPTLLAPWTTRDLVAHLYLREYELAVAPGLVVPGPWGRLAERHRLALKQRPFDELVSAIASGPPPGFFRLGWVRRVPNLNEFFVHHEDVRRANGLPRRELPLAEEDALFRNLAMARVLARHVRGVGVQLVWAATDRRRTARRGQPTAELVGLPSELLLYLFGRRDVADVEVRGPSHAVDVVQRTSFGI